MLPPPPQPVNPNCQHNKNGKFRAGKPHLFTNPTHPKSSFGHYGGASQAVKVLRSTIAFKCPRPVGRRVQIPTSVGLTNAEKYRLQEVFLFNQCGRLAGSCSQTDTEQCPALSVNPTILLREDGGSGVHLSNGIASTLPSVRYSTARVSTGKQTLHRPVPLFSSEHRPAHCLRSNRRYLTATRSSWRLNPPCCGSTNMGRVSPVEPL